MPHAVQAIARPHRVSPAGHVAVDARLTAPLRCARPPAADTTPAKELGTAGCLVEAERSRNRSVTKDGAATGDFRRNGAVAHERPVLTNVDLWLSRGGRKQGAGQAIEDPISVYTGHGDVKGVGKPLFRMPV